MKNTISEIISVDSIRIDDIPEIIPGILTVKFQKLNILTVGDLRRVDAYEFSKIKSIGKRSVEALFKLKDQIIDIQRK